MKVSIMQPNIFMWNGLVKQMIDSDLHIILDHVKASKNQRYNRNRIAGRGDETWFTIPMIEFSRNKCICEIELDIHINKKKGLMRMFEDRYKGASYFKYSREILNKTLESQISSEKITIVYERFLMALKEYGIPMCKTIRSTEICDKNKEIKQAKGVDIVNKLLEHVGATTYLAAQNTTKYASSEDYNIKDVLIQNFKSKKYSQAFGEGSKAFKENLSCLDTLTFIGQAEMLEYLEESNSWNKL